MLAKDLIALFNIAARTEYNRSYQAFDPKFKELMFEYESGPVETVNFPFFSFLTGMEAFTGSRTHQTFPDGYKFTVSNKEWDMAVDIPMKDIDRAANVNSITGLNIYTQRIAEMPVQAKDHPAELAFEMLEAGDASTYGYSFDGQTFFATTHNYGTTSGTQSNVITSGSGTSVANLITDLDRCLAALNGFYYNQGGTSNGKKRKLNSSLDKFLVVCPDELFATFNKVRTQARLSSGEDNIWYNRFDISSRPMTDTGDWYLVVLGDRQFRPFLYQVEKPVELDLPTLQDEGARERKTLTYGAYGRYNIAYGAWWKAIMVQNS